MSDKPTEIVPETLHRDRYITIEVHMSERDRKTCADALDEVGYGMADAANLFALLKDLNSDGEAASPGVRSLLNVCAAHFAAMVEGPVDSVFTMAQKLHMERHQADQFRTGDKTADPELQPKKGS
jgi:hypothetical protein